ncbi:hypothetical protein GGX14DRAFT_390848 [Mycena pura]|uniref:Uncharacterized protein n=1 Tax=Mycena pura TaxID=153505 RepID=A0AAD6VND1_9AGAR|nr:hypothetical protein GGX14DRAFT_390848 [Mycena pura]
MLSKVPQVYKGFPKCFKFAGVECKSMSTAHCFPTLHNTKEFRYFCTASAPIWTSWYTANGPGSGFQMSIRPVTTKCATWCQAVLHPGSGWAIQLDMPAGNQRVPTC